MIVDKPTTEGIIIDLTGPQGNAFFLIGTAKKFCKQLGYHEKPVIDDMMSGDYENLIEVFEKHFGDFVTMYI